MDKPSNVLGYWVSNFSMCLKCCLTVEPVEMCHEKRCNDPEGCARKAKLWALRQEKNLWIGERLLAELRESRIGKKSWIRNTDHADRQQVHRCISEREERLLIDHEAWPFEYYKNKDGSEKLSLIGHLKIGEKRYRPIHIILGRQNGKQWKVVTIYDPQTQEFKWANNYQKRICFCRFCE